jgi:hypothetical protein
MTSHRKAWTVVLAAFILIKLGPKLAGLIALGCAA